MSEAPAITVDGLEKRFGEFTAVAGISFSIRAGEIFGFPRAERRGQEHHDPDAVRTASRRSGGRGTVAGFDIVRETERIRADRLHEPEVLPLR
jgi:ABC-2 type transport system ATP-binding protein